MALSAGWSQAPVALALRPRSLTTFGVQVRDAGWAIETAKSNPLYHVVTLKK